MGAIDEAFFDHDCIAAFKNGAEGPLTALLDARMEAAGNGTHEVRNWVIAHAAAGGRGFDLIDYRASARKSMSAAAGAVVERVIYKATALRASGLWFRLRRTTPTRRR